MATFTTLSFSDITIEFPGDLFLPVPLTFIPGNLQGKTGINNETNMVIIANEIEMDFATNPDVFDMNLNTTPITCYLPSSQKYIDKYLYFYIHTN